LIKPISQTKCDGYHKFDEFLFLCTVVYRCLHIWQPFVEKASKVKCALEIRRTQAANSSRHVASMLHGVAGKVWEALKRKVNCCDRPQHEIRGRDNLSR
jgi:hypothetical protein